MKKTVLITGASSGFGLLLANSLHNQGFEVIGTSREPEKHEGKVPFKLLRLDISDDNSINAFAEELFRSVRQLDVLVNNAGYMVTGLAEETPVELGRQQFETNFWGTIKVTNALLPRADHHNQLHRRLDRPAESLVLHGFKARSPGLLQISALRAGSVQHPSQHGGASVVQDQPRS